MTARQAVVNAWDEGISRLIEAGVTGRIILANIGSSKGLEVCTVPVLFWRRSGEDLFFFPNRRRCFGLS